MPFTFTNDFGDTITVDLQPDQYVDNNSLVILAFEPDGCLYTILTVNLNYPLDADEIFVDTNNAPKNLIKLLEKESIFKPTGLTWPSGHYIYPAYRLTQKGIDLLSQTEAGEDMASLFDEMIQTKADRKESE